MFKDLAAHVFGTMQQAIIVALLMIGDGALASSFIPSFGIEPNFSKVASASDCEALRLRLNLLSGAQCEDLQIANLGLTDVSDGELDVPIWMALVRTDNEVRSRAIAFVWNDDTIETIHEWENVFRIVYWRSSVLSARSPEHIRLGICLALPGMVEYGRITDFRYEFGSNTNRIGCPRIANNQSTTP